MELLLLAPLLDSSHIVPKRCSYLVSCFGNIEGCAGIIKYAGPPMSPNSSTLIYITFYSCLVLFSLWLVFLILYGPVVPAVAWKSPKCSFMLELDSEIMLG